MFGIYFWHCAWGAVFVVVCDKIKYILIAGCKSVHSHLNVGVPEDSVLGPKIYYMYTKPLADIIKWYGFKYHCCADDTQVYMTLKWRDNMDEAVH